jgi:hypothetical protein
LPGVDHGVSVSVSASGWMDERILFLCILAGVPQASFSFLVMRDLGGPRRDRS